MPLLRSETYVNDLGRSVLKEYYGIHNEDGEEIVTATCEVEQLTEEEVAEMEKQNAEIQQKKKDEETAKQEQLNRIEQMLSELLSSK